MSDENITQWEYKARRISLMESDIETLNKLGEEGWELTGNVCSGSESVILKRPKQKKRLRQSDDYGYSR